MVALTLTARRFVSSTTGTRCMHINIFIVVMNLFYYLHAYVMALLFFFISLSNVSVFFRNYHNYLISAFGMYLVLMS